MDIRPDSLNRIACWLFYLVAICIFSAPLAGPQIGTGAFPKTERIDNNLVRSESTRADVQRLLGLPNGAGGALLPGFGDERESLEAYDVWYYEDIDTGNMKSKEGVMVMDMHQQILLIFFRGDKFYGYFWTSNRNVAEMR